VLIAQCLFLKLKNINQILAVINVHTMVGEWVGIMKWTSMETSDLYIDIYMFWFNYCLHQHC
jgi:hypothetical protein